MNGAGRGRGAVLDAQFHEDLLEMFVDRPGADVEDFADLAVGLAAADPQQDLGFALGEREMPLENAFQGSKVFEHGGPYTDLFEVDPREAKRDPRLRTSGALKGFEFDGYEFPLKPTTVFYDWLYLNAIFPHRQWLKNRVDGEMRYDGFSDIEFNPSKSINCQAKSCALFVSLMREEKLENYLQTPSHFIAAMAAHMSDLSSHQPHVKQPRLVG